MASSNLKLLTKSHNIVAAKKRARHEQIKEVVFDDEARREFLTGFHKRKLQKKEDAKKNAQEREKKERLEARREQRQLLAQRATQNAAEAEKAYGGHVDGAQDSQAAWTGFASGSEDTSYELEKEEEYEYDEHIATVTVVEDFDPDALIHGPTKPRRASSSDPTPDPTASHNTGFLATRMKDSTSSSFRTKPADSPERSRAKAKGAAKAKEIKYQTSAARKAERMKQKRRKTEKAERAGGKAARKKGPARRKR